MNDDIMHRFIQVTLQFKKINMCELYQVGIPFAEMMLMNWVKEQCPVSGGCLNVSEVADRLCVTRPAVSQILSSLEGKGYIVRQIDPADRRRILVRSTERGDLALNEVRKRYDDAVGRFLERMMVEELEALIHHMGRMVDIFDEMRGLK